jgi:hypothetical protein
LTASPPDPPFCWCSTPVYIGVEHQRSVGRPLETGGWDVGGEQLEVVRGRRCRASVGRALRHPAARYAAMRSATSPAGRQTHPAQVFRGSSADGAGPLFELGLGRRHSTPTERARVDDESGSRPRARTTRAHKGPDVARDSRSRDGNDCCTRQA